MFPFDDVMLHHEFLVDMFEQLAHIRHCYHVPAGKFCDGTSEVTLGDMGAFDRYLSTTK